MRTELVELVNTVKDSHEADIHTIVMHKKQYTLAELWDIAQTIESYVQDQELIQNLY